MKKQFQILSAIFMTIVLVSCSKQDVEAPQTPANANEEIATSSASAAGRIVIDPLAVNLEGSFKFDGTLKDNTKNIGDGVPTARGVVYTTDRKGNEKSALYLDGYYGVKLKKVPQQTNTSLSVWVKPALFNYANFTYVIGSSAYGPVATQVYSSMTGGVVMNSTSAGGMPYHFADNNWHHMVITYDGFKVRVYIDGQFHSDNHETGFIPASFSDFFLGCAPGKTLWKGAFDDLRFYSKTLSATEVSALFNL